MSELEHGVAAARQIEAIPSILEVVCKSTGMGFAAVARVTQTRWIACEVLDNVHFGLESGGELPVETTLCSEVHSRREEIVIDNVADDPVYADHHTPRIYGLQSYISVPIILPDGDFFGTLCAIDAQPHRLSESVGMFRLFAQLIAFHLDANRKLNNSRSDLRDARAQTENAQFDLERSQAKLLDATESSNLREQFIAVLGHDLRNPLAALTAGRRMLEKQHDDPESVRILRYMGESTDRMSGLIDNVMDFARGQLGGGIGVEHSGSQSLEPLLAQVVNEIRAAHPERAIETRFDLHGTINVDRSRFAQMFSNLLGNAITHGGTDTPIIVTSRIVDDVFELSVENSGDPIPPAAQKRLFQPFARGDLRPSLQGLGLGLYIASEIAKAHGGRLDVKSDETGTRFTFCMSAQQT